MPAKPSPRADRLSRRHLLQLAGAGAVASMAALPLPARAAHVVKPWPASKPVPALDLPDLDGKRWQLASVAGQVVVANFWATWCEPCRVEMPSLQALAAKRRKDGVTVVAVNYHEAGDVIQRFLERMPFKVRVLLDSDGDATVAWTPRVFPSTVLIGRDGVPQHIVLGELDWEGSDARALLEPMIAAPRKAAS